MAKNKGSRIFITLECTECRTNANKRSTGVSRYLTQKNRRNNPQRMELKKYYEYENIHYKNFTFFLKYIIFHQTEIQYKY